MLLLTSLVFVILDGLLGAPTGREVYRMPQSALKGIFTHFSFQSGLLSYLMEVMTRVFSSNYRLENVFMQREKMHAFGGKWGLKQTETTLRALRFFLVKKVFPFSLLPSRQCLAGFYRPSQQ